MRPTPGHLKFFRPGTDPLTMKRGGTRLRRRVMTLTLIASSALGMLPLGPTTIAVAAARGPGSPHGDVAAGEYGSGPAPIPVHIPAAARTRRAGVKWSDVGSGDAWARSAIDYVGGAFDWMRDFPANADGTYPFRPSMIETRKYFARAVVKAFAPDETVDPSIAFTDLDTTQVFYRWANVAVKMGWMRRTADGGFLPDKPVTMTTVHRVLVLALGLRSTAQQLDALHTSGGVTFHTPVNFGTTMLGMRLGLRYNSDANEAQDVGPSTPMPRSQVAFSLYKAKTLPSWTVPWIAGQYEGIRLPKMGPSRQAIVQWGIRYVGYPYVWGGEWGLATPEPSGLGGQPIAGFDCSGFSWWTLRANDGGIWKVAPPRPYAGWQLPQRSSADMARTGHLKFDQLVPGDLMFYDGDDDGIVDHVDVYIGNGFSLDSSHTPGGVTIMWVGDGWYRDHFVHGRRILPLK